MGIKQIGWYAFGKTDVWSVKAAAHRMEADGSFYMYANDQLRGFDVYRFDASKPRTSDTGRWLDAAQARRVLGTRSGGSFKPFCVLTS